MIQKTIHLGPIHTALPGAMKLSVDLSGDQILSSRVEFGFLSKSICSQVQGMRALAAQKYFSHLEPESAFLLDRLFSEAIEQSQKIELNPRIVWIREVTTLLCELSGFLKYLAMMADRMGLEILNHILFKHCEELLDLVELLTGSRYGYGYLQPGGARYDITDGFVERLENWIKNYQSDYSRIESFYRWTHPIHNRLKSLGRIVDNGSLGFISNASVETTQYGLVSHVESRLRYALKQTQETAGDLHDLIGQRHSGNFQVSPLNEIAQHRPQQNKIVVELETGRGDWRFTLELNSEFAITRAEVASPSDQISHAIAQALEDEQFDDLPLILQSLNFLVTEIDQ